MSVSRTVRLRQGRLSFPVTTRQQSRLKSMPERVSLSPSPDPAPSSPLPLQGNRLELSLAEHIPLFIDHATAGSVPPDLEIAITYLGDLVGVAHAFDELTVSVQSVSIGQYEDEAVHKRELYYALVSIATKARELSVLNVCYNRGQYAEQYVCDAGTVLLLEELTLRISNFLSPTMMAFFEVFSSPDNFASLTTITFTTQMGKQVEWGDLARLRFPALSSVSFVSIKSLQPLYVAKFLAQNRTLKSISVMGWKPTRSIAIPADPVASFIKVDYIHGSLDFLAKFVPLLHFSSVIKVYVDHYGDTKTKLRQIQTVIQHTRTEDIAAGSVDLAVEIPALKFADILGKHLSDSAIISSITSYLAFAPNLQALRLRKYPGDDTIRSRIDEILLNSHITMKYEH